MQLDRRTGLLWVAGDEREPDGSTTSTVKAYDRDGALVERLVVPGTRFLNDVQVTGDAVYVTDSLSAELVVVHGGSFSLLPLTGDWVQPSGFGANGIRELPGGDLVITNSSTGGLFQVEPATGVAARITLRGPALSSGDGLELRGDTLYVVYGFGTDAIAVVHLEGTDREGTDRDDDGRDDDGRDRGRTATPADSRDDDHDEVVTGTVTGRLTDPDLDRPTTAVQLAGALYAVNGRFSTPPTPTTAYSVVRVALPHGRS